jgi:hypothetical protein
MDELFEETWEEKWETGSNNDAHLVRRETTRRK